MSRRRQLWRSSRREKKYVDSSFNHPPFQIVHEEPNRRRSSSTASYLWRTCPATRAKSAPVRWTRRSMPSLQAAAGKGPAAHRRLRGLRARQVGNAQRPAPPPRPPAAQVQGHQRRQGGRGQGHLHHRESGAAQLFRCGTDRRHHVPLHLRQSAPPAVRAY